MSKGVRNPLVVILGATGTGKSKLAVQIAKRFNGEVISADSMQVYRGLDIITNKVTDEEKDGVKHHMLDIIKPPALFSVLDFRNKALPIIREMPDKGILPVVVGGTNYYIESLLWKVLVESEDEESGDERLESGSDPESDLVLLKCPHDELQRVAKALALAAPYLLGFAELSERVFLSYLQKRIDLMPKFHDSIGDLLDSPPEFSDNLLIIQKAHEILDQITEYELGSINISTRYRWIIDTFRDIEKVLVIFLKENYEIIVTSESHYGEKSGKLKEMGELLKSMHSVPCLQDIEFSVSNYSKPAEYAILSLRLLALKANNCFIHLTAIIRLFIKILPTLNYCTLVKICDQVELVGEACWSKLVPGLWRIVEEESLKMGPDMPSPPQFTSQLFHSLLVSLDPQAAASLHPNDTRKILRCIQVVLQKRKKYSELVEEQKSEDNGGSSLGGGLRYHTTAVLWLQCQKEVLEARLDARVDEMMSKGLLNELISFYDQHKEDVAENPARLTQGIFQSIGFKEFDSYLRLSKEERLCDSGQKALSTGLSCLRLVTKRYAKRQNKWVKQRFINTPDRHVPDVYALDTSDEQKWDSNVLEPASRIVRSLLGQSDDSDSCAMPTAVPRPISPPPNNKSRHHCQICDRVFIGDVQWNAHMKSKKHQKVSRKMREASGSNKRERLDQTSLTVSGTETSSFGDERPSSSASNL